MRNLISFIILLAVYGIVFGFSSSKASPTHRVDCTWDEHSERSICGEPYRINH